VTPTIDMSGVLAPSAGARGLFRAPLALLFLFLSASPSVARIVASLAGGNGSGVSGYADGAGTRALFSNPTGLLALPASNVVYVSDAANNAVRVIGEDLSVTTVAGLGSSPGGYANGVGSSARFQGPNGLSYDAAAAVFYVADKGNHKIRTVVAATMVVATFVGGGASGAASGWADAAGTNALFNTPSAVAFHSAAGTLYVADTLNHRVRSVTTGVPTGVVTTLAGQGSGPANGVGVAAQFNQPSGIAVSPAGRVFVADTLNNKIRAIDAGSQMVTTLAGGGLPGRAAGAADGVGTNALFESPSGVAHDAASDALYVADFGNNKVRCVLANGTVFTLAGGGGSGRSSGAVDGSGGAGGGARFSGPLGVAVGPGGLLYVGDSGNNKVRVVFPFNCPAGSVIDVPTRACTTPTASPTPSGSGTPSPTPSGSGTPSHTPSRSRTASATASGSPTPSSSQTGSPTGSGTPPATPSPSPTGSVPPPPSATPTPSPSPPPPPFGFVATAGTAGGTNATVGAVAGGLLGALALVAGGAALRRRCARARVAAVLSAAAAPAAPDAEPATANNPLHAQPRGGGPEVGLEWLALLRAEPANTRALRWAACNGHRGAVAGALAELRAREAAAQEAAAVAARQGDGGGGGPLLSALRAAGEAARRAREAHEAEVVIEAPGGAQYVIVRGAALYLDGRGGRAMAEGWRRFEDAEGDVWYTSPAGESEWEPVYADSDDRGGV
jgi:hypothetical protein